jgi:hypothetical protein
MKQGIMVVFKEFHCRRKFVNSFNANFLSLIPKKAGVVDIKDFCPISLVSGVYKTISMVLANMSKLVLRKNISNS